jgi:hypothetical protein
VPTVNGRPLASNPRMPPFSTRASIPFACSVRAARALVASSRQPQ